MHWPNLKSVAFPVPEIIWSTRKNWAVPGYAHAPFSTKILMGFFQMDTQYVLAKFEVRIALPVPEKIAIGVLGGLRPQSWGGGGRRGSGMVPFERALVSSCRPSIVTFPLSLRVSEILSLLCSSTPLFPTPPLVSPKFHHVPLGLDGCSLGCEEGYRNCPCN